MGRKQRNKAEEKDLALSQIKNYFLKADTLFPTEPALADRYVTLARKTSMKYQVTIPSELKKKFCRHCYRYLRPGATSRVRTSPSGQRKVVTACLLCKKHMRHPYTMKNILKDGN